MTWHRIRFAGAAGTGLIYRADPMSDRAPIGREGGGFGRVSLRPVAAMETDAAAGDRPGQPTFGPSPTQRDASIGGAARRLAPESVHGQPAGIPVRAIGCHRDPCRDPATAAPHRCVAAMGPTDRPPRLSFVSSVAPVARSRADEFALVPDGYLESQLRADELLRNRLDGAGVTVAPNSGGHQNLCVIYSMLQRAGVPPEELDAEALLTNAELAGRPGRVGQGVAGGSRRVCRSGRVPGAERAHLPPRQRAPDAHPDGRRARRAGAVRPLGGSAGSRGRSRRGLASRSGVRGVARALRGARNSGSRSISARPRRTTARKHIGSAWRLREITTTTCRESTVPWCCRRCRRTKRRISMSERCKCMKAGSSA